DEDHGKHLTAEGARLLGVIRDSARRMEEMIDELLRFSRMGRQPLQTMMTDLDQFFAQCVKDIERTVSGRRIQFVLGDLGYAQVDPSLLKHVAENLLGNAVKYTRERDSAVVEVGRLAPEHAGAPDVYFVRDNGAGFDMKYADR